jgi:hypothetical protein
MQTLARETLRRMVEELPTVPWRDQDLSGLIARSDGVITGFPELLADIEALCRIDLGADGLPGPLR